LVQLIRTGFGRVLKVDFEMIGGAVAQGGVSAPGVVIGYIMADFKLGPGQARDAFTLPGSEPADSKATPSGINTPSAA
jgi:hypothetical protein